MPATPRDAAQPADADGDIQDRLSRIEGHIRGIKKMVAEGKDAEQVLTQVIGVKAAINQVALRVLERQVQMLSGSTPEEREQALAAYKKSLGMFLR